jgi:putative ABC transport system substrate-binding protein
MTQLGLVEGKNLIVDLRSARGDESRLAALASELLALKPDVIYAASSPAALAAKKATSTVPIVFTVGNPVALGLVPSLSRPGGNLTGNALMSGPLDSKRVQLLSETLGDAATIAVINTTIPEKFRSDFISSLSVAVGGRADRVGLIEIDNIDEFPAAFERIAQRRFGGVAICQSQLAQTHQGRIADLISKYRLPAIADGSTYTEKGLLLTYTTDFHEVERRAARYIHKILLGAKPGDLPSEQPTKFNFVVNLRTAKALKIAVPASVLAFADQVIS